MQKPIPLIDKDRGLAVFFSAKSGCTFVSKWFFYQNNHIQKALTFHPFIHQYRNKVYKKSKHFEESKKDFIRKKGKGYLKIKVVRNPFERAVSSYVHFLVMIKLRDREIRKDFDITFKEIRHSFSEFLDLIKELDIENCNIHWRQQYQVIEDKMDIDYIVDLKKSTDKLQEIETLQGLKPSKNIESLVHSKHHTKKKKSLDHVFCGNRRFTFKVKNSRPAYSCFYNEEIEKKVIEIYKADFEKYGFARSYITEKLAKSLP